MRRIFKCLLITLAFWALAVLGPFMILLWNALSPRMARYEEGDLGYTILIVVAQAVSCGLAYSAANHLSDGNHDVCTLVNSIICTVVIVALFVFSASVTEYVRYALAFIVCICCSYSKAKDIGNKIKTHQEQKDGTNA